MRINRFLAKALNISRRDADELIKSGKITFNGEILNDFVEVGESDIVEFNGKRVQIEKGDVYFAFYKPPFVITSTYDEEGRTTVCDFFANVKNKLICVGRLDYLSEGLLIVTSDGKFANLLMHPRFKIKKTYLVKTKDVLGADLLKKMSKGIELEDGFFKPITIKRTQNPNWIVITIDTGRNRIIRRFLKAFNVKIERLKRIAIGPIELGNMKQGEYRELTKDELKNIKRMVYKRKNVATV